jgi:hypothetical protein
VVDHEGAVILHIVLQALQLRRTKGISILPIYW